MYSFLFSLSAHRQLCFCCFYLNWETDHTRESNFVFTGHAHIIDIVGTGAFREISSYICDLFRNWKLVYVCLIYVLHHFPKHTYTYIMLPRCGRKCTQIWHIWGFNSLLNCTFGRTLKCHQKRINTTFSPFRKGCPGGLGEVGRAVSRMLLGQSFIAKRSKAKRSQPAESWLEFLNIYKSNNEPWPIGHGKGKQTGR